MNKKRKILSRLKQKERKRLRWYKHEMDGIHFPKEILYHRFSTWTCINCKHFGADGMRCMMQDGKLPYMMFCESYEFVEDRLRRKK